ncbi:Ras-related protein Rab-5C [Nematocida homosporus]|uniref:Ras-related protein Rab-5C n=1 Tax=Nematocida homosporus TaxID=1912981 RepID=UPI00221E4AD9|nr:Ras-related protein Rab-5C [Nematocida homosporus]KAI5184600.1 Ras-related protein Rab-5C [Nematocida homosporus]
MDCRAKVAILGACGSGKSSVTKKFLTGSFDPNHPATIGAAYQSKKIERNGECISVDIWDTAGQERYGAIAPMYYRDAHAVIVVYDVTDLESVSAARKWCSTVRAANKKGLLFVFGNKVDLMLKNYDAPAFMNQPELGSVKETLRSLSETATAQFKEYQAVHMCGSAKTGEGVDFLFQSVMNQTEYTRRISEVPNAWCCF